MADPIPALTSTRKKTTSVKSTSKAKAPPLCFRSGTNRLRTRYTPRDANAQGVARGEDSNPLANPAAANTSRAHTKTRLQAGGNGSISTGTCAHHSANAGIEIVGRSHTLFPYQLALEL